MIRGIRSTEDEYETVYSSDRDNLKKSESLKSEHGGDEDAGKKTKGASTP